MKASLVRTPFLTVGLLLGVSLPALAGSVDLVWDPSSGATGYKVHAGAATGSYGTPLDVGSSTQTTFSTMADCTATFFAVTAYNAAGDSGYSNEISSWPRPALASVNPTEAERGATISLVISGNNFEPGASVVVSNSGVTVNSVTRNSCGQITASITIGGSAPFGTGDVSVVNTNGVTGTSSGVFSVVGSPLPNVDNLRRTDKQR
jgi:hypothetical protein